MKKLNYGTDAPNVIRNLLVIGLILLLLSLFLPLWNSPQLMVAIKNTLFFPGFFMILGALFMIAYGRFGKFRQRERILNLHQWRGDEIVLDVGAGLGLLMIGVAKKLTTGKSYGMDIFNKYDLSNNSIEQTKTNIEIEGVVGNTVIVEANILENNFSSDFFDVIVFNLCLHNIYDSIQRDKACKEISRILKPGGEAIISDFKHTGRYAEIFESLGMQIVSRHTRYLDTFPPLTIIKAKK